ncbi:MAG: tetratricopeptide repeat protein [Cryomorphaceae bacterium]|nr:tetratricopeptide repeat protein [Cryomorphaceae bacterium]
MNKHFLLYIFFGLLLPWGVVGQITETQRQADQKFRMAMTAFDQKVFANARENFEQALATEALPLERKIEALYFRAIAALELFHADAEALMQSFIEEYPTSSFVNQARLYLGQFFFRNRNYRKSEKYLTEVNPRFVDQNERLELRFQIGYSYFSNEKYDEAKDIFSTLKQKEGPFAASARYYYAHIVYADENFTEALINFEALRNDQAFGRMVPFYLAHVYYQMRAFDSLFVYGAEILSDDEAPRRAEIAKLVGDAHYREENFKKAVEYFTIFREEGGKPTRNDHFEMGFCYYRLEDYDKAIEHFSRVSMGKDELAQTTYYHLGDCHLQKEDKQSALTAFLAAAEINANPEVKEDAYFQFVKLNYEMGGVFRDVVTALNDFRRLYPNSEHRPKINTLLANAYLRSKNYARAAQALQDAGLRTMEQRGIYQKVAYFQGVEAYQKEQYASSIVHFGESRKYPVDQFYVSLALYWAAESFFQLMEYEAAISAYLEFQQSPQAYSTEYFPYSHYGLGYAYYLNNQLENAAISLRRFSREKDISPGRMRDGLLRLADVYFLLRQYPQALDFYDRVNNRFEGTNNYASFQKAICLGLTGEDRQKIAELDALVKRAPSSQLAFDARFEKAATYIKISDYSGAIQIYQTFIREHPNHPNVPRAKLNMSLAYRNSGNYNEAIRLLKEVVKLFPNTNEANEAIAFGQNVFSEADRMGEYVSWVQESGGGNVEQGKLDSALYFSAYDQYSLSNYEASIKNFKEYLERFPVGLFANSASYYLGDAYYRLENDKEALKYFEAVLANDRSPFYDRALERAASLRYFEKDYLQAGNYYRQILDRKPMEELTQLAYDRMMRIAYFTADWPKLEDWSEKVLSTNPEEARLRRDANWFQALALYRQHRRPQADTALKFVVDHYQGNIAARASYYLAEFAFEDVRYEETKAAVYGLIEKFPGELELRDKGLLLLAKVFMDEEDYFQAEYSLDFVIQSDLDKETTDQARQLMGALRTLQESGSNDKEDDSWEIDPRSKQSGNKDDEADSEQNSTEETEGDTEDTNENTENRDE